MTFYVESNGKWLGVFDGVEPPEGAIEVNQVPEYASQVWDFEAEAFSEPPQVIPESVSARQFRLQLRKPVLPNYPDGIRDAVLAFVAQQSGDVQDAFEYSGSFVRNDPTMQAGFEQMGFTPDQVDAFFLAASKL